MGWAGPGKLDSFEERQAQLHQSRVNKIERLLREAKRRTEQAAALFEEHVDTLSDNARGELAEEAAQVSDEAHRIIAMKRGR